VAAKYSMFEERNPLTSPGSGDTAFEERCLFSQSCFLPPPTLAPTIKLQIIQVVPVLPQHEFNLSIGRLLFPGPIEIFYLFQLETILIRSIEKVCPEWTNTTFFSIVEEKRHCHLEDRQSKF
jgi:hypothetical protein